MAKKKKAFLNPEDLETPVVRRAAAMVSKQLAARKGAIPDGLTEDLLHEAYGELTKGRTLSPQKLQAALSLVGNSIIGDNGDDPSESSNGDLGTLPNMAAALSEVPSVVPKGKDKPSKNGKKKSTKSAGELDSSNDKEMNQALSDPEVLKPEVKLADLLAPGTKKATHPSHVEPEVIEELIHKGTTYAVKNGYNEDELTGFLKTAFKVKGGKNLPPTVLKDALFQIQDNMEELGQEVPGVNPPKGPPLITPQPGPSMGPEAAAPPPSLMPGSPPGPPPAAPPETPGVPAIPAGEPPIQMSPVEEQEAAFYRSLGYSPEEALKGVQGSATARTLLGEKRPSTGSLSDQIDSALAEGDRGTIPLEGGGGPFIRPGSQQDLEARIGRLSPKYQERVKFNQSTGDSLEAAVAAAEGEGTAATLLGTDTGAIKTALEAAAKEKKGLLGKLFGSVKSAPLSWAGYALDAMFLPGAIRGLSGADIRDARKMADIAGKMQVAQQPSLPVLLAQQKMEMEAERRARVIQTGDPGLAQLLQGLPETTPSEVIVGGKGPDKDAMMNFIRQDMAGDGSANQLAQQSASDRMVSSFQ